MRHLFLYFAIGAIFFTAFDTTLTDMTIADCQAGILKACEELKK